MGIRRPCIARHFGAIAAVVLVAAVRLAFADVSRTGFGPWGFVPPGGTGASPARAGCAVSPDHLSFVVPPGEESTSRTFMVTNTGTTVLAGSITASCSGSGTYVVEPPEYSLPAGQSMVITVYYLPTACSFDECRIDVGTGCAVYCDGSGLPRPYSCGSELTFDTSEGLSLLSGVLRLELADLEGDSRLDLVAFDGESLAVARDFAYRPAAAIRYYAEAGPGLVCLADCDADGRPEIIVATAAGLRIHHRVARPSGSDWDSVATVAYPPRFCWGSICDDASPLALAAADLNHDSRADLIATVVYSIPAHDPVYETRAALASASGGYLPWGSAIWPPRGGPLTTVDLDGDGDLDLFRADFLGSNGSVALGDGAGGFSTWGDLAFPSRVSEVVGCTLNADLSGDLVALCPDAGVLRVFRSRSTGMPSFLSAAEDYPVSSAAPPFGDWRPPGALAVGDVSRDVASDVLVTNHEQSAVSVLRNPGRGCVCQALPALAGVGRAVAIGDVDGDGFVEAAIASATGPGIHVMRRSGSAPVPQFVRLQVGGVDVDDGSQVNVECDVSHEESFTLLAEVANNGRAGAAAYNNISANVSQFNVRADTARISLEAMSPGLVYGEYFANDGTGGPDGYYESVFVEANDNNGWPTGERNTLRLSIRPKSYGVQDVFVRTAVNSLPNWVHGWVYVPPIGEPDCTGIPAKHLRVHVLAPYRITSVTDVGNDQGGRVRVRWSRQRFDTLGADTTILSYRVWRRVDGNRARLAPGYDHDQEPLAKTANGDWEPVAAVPAHGEAAYGALCATLQDSTVVTGARPTAFFVRAETASPLVFFDSPVDSGCSVDNLSPPPPGPITGEYTSGATRLQWGASGAPDLAGYHVFRGLAPDFVPTSDNRIASPADTTLMDVGPPGRWYKVSAVDLHGNASAFVSFGSSNTTGLPSESTRMLALTAVSPNPVRGSRAMVTLALLTGAPATLELLDVAGRRVTAVPLHGLGVGAHAVSFPLERRGPAGLYWLRLHQSGRVAILRVVLLD